MMMKHRSTRDGRRDEGGFTLIELLVVIIILGVLSAVVVFAVRGAGDKGKAAAITTDEKTIRTAEEAYCAKTGQYGSSGQLLGLAAGPDGQMNKFLSDEPQYHGVVAIANSGGPCNGWTFQIAQSAAAFGGPGPGDFQPVGDPPPLGLANKLVQLENGKVLALGLTADFGGPGAALFDTATSAWTVADDPPQPFNVGSAAILLTGGPALCGDRCGKVLTHFGYDWRLFNPNATLGTQWETIAASASSYSGQHFGDPGAVLLTDTPSTPTSECAPNCGRVFIQSFEPNTTRLWELYDPVQNIFAQFHYSDLTQAAQVVGLPTRLADGRIFMTNTGYGSSSSSTETYAKLFDPKNAFSDATPYVFPNAALPKYGWSDLSIGQQNALLPNGDLFYTGLLNIGYDSSGHSVNASEIYRPDPSGTGPGQWLPAGPSCTTLPVDINHAYACYILASLPDGRVLAEVLDSYGLRIPFFADGKTYLWSPKTQTWSRSGDAPPYASGVGVYLDPAVVGGCAAQCGKVLIAGYNTSDGSGPNLSAQLYTPPPA